MNRSAPVATIGCSVAPRRATLPRQPLGPPATPTSARTRRQRRRRTPRSPQNGTTSRLFQRHRARATAAPPAFAAPPRTCAPSSTPRRPRSTPAGQTTDAVTWLPRRAPRGRRLRPAPGARPEHQRQQRRRVYLDVEAPGRRVEQALGPIASAAGHHAARLQSAAGGAPTMRRPSRRPHRPATGGSPCVTTNAVKRPMHKPQART